MSISQRRVHSPSLPDIWVPTNHASGEFQSPSGSKPNLGVIDVAASPHSKSALPLTPPLTPASTRATDTDLSDTRSSRSNSVDATGSLLPSFDAYSSQSKNPSAPLQWRSPMYRSSQSQDYLSQNQRSDYSALPSPTSPSRPRHPHPEPEFEAPSPTRFLFVTGVPTTASSEALKQAFVDSGHLKGIFIRFQAEHGIIILAFFDLRHTIRAHGQINSRNFFDGHRLQCRFMSSNELHQIMGQSKFINQNDGELLISTSPVGLDGELDTVAIQNVLASFGDLLSFGMADAHIRTFHVEFFDARDALSAYNSLNGRVIFGVRLHLSLRDNASFARHSDTIPFSPVESSSGGGIPFPSKESPLIDHHPALPSSAQLLPDTEEPVTRPTLNHSQSEQNLRMRPRAHSIASPDPCRLYAETTLSSSYVIPSQNPSRSPSNTPTPTPHPRVKTPPEHVHSRRISNIYHFDSVGRTMLELPHTMPPRPRSISVSSETGSPVAGRLTLPPPSPNANSGECHLPQSPIGTHEAITLDYQPAEMNWPLTYAPEPCLSQPSEETLFTRPHLSRCYQSDRYSRVHGNLGLDVPGEREKEKEVQPERNRIDIGKIERGEETRTTVMIKNIPNKMSDKNLIDFINEVCPRKVDFLYLRMDFTNGCNVGYAFVNFIRVEDLLHFAKTKLGTKWNLFSSEKVLGMSYANYQGKEALIDKFRSSSIMDQREAWRPKLFYSSGLNQGLPEDWPAPTHIRRKERSSLFPSELHQSRTLLHHPHMRG